MDVERLKIEKNPVFILAKNVADRQLERAESVSKEAEIAKKFNLKDAELSVFNGAFALYLETKSSHQATDLAKRPIFEQMLKAPVFKHIAEQVYQTANVEELTVKILKKSVGIRSVHINSKEDCVGSGRIIKAANYLSTRYLENPADYLEAVEDSKDFVERILRD